MSYIAFVLDEKSRAEVLKKHPPKFAKVYCHHVTLVFGGSNLEQILSEIKDDMDGSGPDSTVKLIGYASDDSLECFVVEFGSVKVRRDGKLYHITHSLDSPRKPVDSNALLTQKIYAKWATNDFISVSGEIKLLS